MKKNSLFSFKLYREGLRQIRVFSVIPLIFILLAVGLNFASNCITAAAESGYATQSVLSPNELSPLLPFVYVLCAPMLILVLFQFLNHRHQSDFYHAVPQPRQCVALSFFAAALTWIVICAVVPALCSALLYRVFLFQYFTFDMSLVLSGVLNSIVISLLIMSAVFLAMTVTGTLFSNGIVALLILFLPRFFMMIVNGTIDHSLIPSTALSFPFGPFNMLFNVSFYSLFSTYGGLYPFDGWALLYTTVLATLYFLLGLFLFKRRPSEAAGNPAPTRRIQAFHRIVVTCAIAFPLTLLFISNPPTGAEQILLYVIGYIVAVMAYFIYELLSTRTVRYMVKIIPGLLLVAIFCVGGAFLSKGFYRALLNDVPKAESLKQIYIEGIDTYYNLSGSWEMYDSASGNYFSEEAGDIAITDEACLKLTANALSGAVDTVKKEGSISTSEGDWAKITFVTKSGHTLTRLIPVTEAECAVLEKALTESAAYKSVFVELPAFKDSFAVNPDGDSYSLSYDQRCEIYNHLRDEVKTINADKWIACLTSADAFDSGEQGDCLLYLTYAVPKNGKTLSMSLPIGSLTPDTLALTQRYITENFNKEKFDEEMLLSEETWEDILNEGYLSVDLFLYQDNQLTESYSCTPYQLYESGFSDSNKTITEAEQLALVKQWNDALSALEGKISSDFDIGKPYLCVSVSHFSYSFGSNYSSSFYIPLGDEGLPADIWGLDDFGTQIDDTGDIVLYDAETVEVTESDSAAEA